MASFENEAIYKATDVLTAFNKSNECFQNENKRISLFMNIINRKTIAYYAEKYPKAKNQLLAWYNEMLKQEFDNLNELKAMYGNASIVNEQRVIFNIKGNEFRLIVSVNFRRKACYAIWFGTHKEYDKIDVATVTYDLDL